MLVFLCPNILLGKVIDCTHVFLGFFHGWNAKLPNATMYLFKLLVKEVISFVSL